MAEDMYDYFDYNSECYQLVTNCTNGTCFNATYPVNCSEMYVYVDQEVAFWQVPTLVILVVLFVAIVFGNTCVLVAIGLSESGRKTRMNFFIMNLAIADLSVGLFHVTTDIAEKCLITWNVGTALCKIVRFLQVFVIYASTFIIVSLSIDRVDAIARPMNFTRKALTVKVLVYAAWIISALLSIPSLLLFDVVNSNGEPHCIIVLKQQWQWQVYITSVALVAFILPALIIAACYTIITAVIWDKGRGLSKTFRSPSYRSASTKLRQQSDRRSKGIIPQAKIRTFKMTLIIVCVFVLSWCPYFVFNLMDAYGKRTYKTPTEFAVTSLAQSLAPLNSAANPIIYGAFSTRICKYLRRIPFVAVICDWLFQCRNNRQSSIHGHSASHTDQTYLDGTAMRHRRSTANSRRLAHELEATTFLAAQNKQSPNNNVICKCNRNSVNKNKNNCCKSTKEQKSIHTRRPSGLPLVNRRMSLQDTIILETYRVSSESSSGEHTCNKSGLPHTSEMSVDTVDYTITFKHNINGGDVKIVTDSKENGTIREESSHFE